MIRPTPFVCTFPQAPLWAAAQGLEVSLGTSGRHSRVTMSDIVCYIVPMCYLIRSLEAASEAGVGPVLWSSGM